MTNETRSKILDELGSPIRVVGLALLIAEASYAGLIFALPQEQRLAGFGVFGGLFTLTLLTLYGIERFRHVAVGLRGNNLIVRELPTKADLYRECARVINSSQKILDVTWGLSPEMTPEETEARGSYRKAVETALKSDKIYRELFSTKVKGLELITTAKATRVKFPRYHSRVIDVDLSSVSMLDFMVADNSRVILSHIDARLQFPMYLYVESADIGEMFARLHSELWAIACDISSGPLPEPPRQSAP